MGLSELLLKKPEIVLLELISFYTDPFIPHLHVLMKSKTSALLHS